MPEKAQFRLTTKKSRSKWYKVTVKFEHKEPEENARFKHAGDAYAYAAKLQDDSTRMGSRLEWIECENM